MPRKYTETRKKITENGTQPTLIGLEFLFAEAERQNCKHTPPLVEKALTHLLAEPLMKPWHGTI